MRLLIPIIHGSEIRQFLFSGFIEEAKNKGYQVVFVHPKKLDIINAEIEKYDNSLIILKNPASFNLKSNTIFSYIKYILDLKNDNTNLFIQKNNNRKEYFKSLMLKSLNLLLEIKFIQKSLIAIESWLAKRIFSEEWVMFLKENKIEEVIINIPNIALALNLSAQKLKIPINIYFHSNKDVTINRSIFKVKKYGVWDSTMKLNVKKNILNYDKDSKIEIIGNLHHSYLRSLKNVLPKKEFDSMFNITAEQLIILYTAAAPWIVKNEFEYVLDLQNYLLQANILNYKIIVRVNPMDNTGIWNKYDSNQVIINKPKWYWNECQNVNFTLYEDLKIYASLLHYSSICVNLPSSVTLEASIKNTPILNICYNHKNVIFYNSNSISKLWNSSFYKEIRKQVFVNEINNRNEWNLILEKSSIATNI